jgi:hypothetical protein
MPTISNAALTLVTVAQDVTVTVTYDAEFSALERQLAGLGMTFHDHLDIFGMDPPASLTGTFIQTFPRAPIAVTVGAVPQIIPRSAQMVVPRAVLDEDAGVNNDEIRVKIRIHSVGLPETFTQDVFTNEQVLP